MSGLDRFEVVVDGDVDLVVDGDGDVIGNGDGDVIGNGDVRVEVVELSSHLADAPFS